MTQTEIVLREIKKNGYASRNWCLAHYISRLSALIYTLKKQGYEFSEGYKKARGVKDYRYILVNEPKNVWK